MSLADSLQQRWYDRSSRPAGWTLPLAGLYRQVTGLRRGLYHRGLLRTRRIPIPVVVVGNLVAGGAGKTPLVIALVDALRACGWHPGVVSRGYHGTTRGPLLLAPHPDPAETGDEPALIRVRTGAPVAIGVDRVAAASLLPDAGVDVVVADDGLQHYALARDVEICVIDGLRRLGNGRLLPAGPLREPASRLREVDFVVCNGGEPRPREIPMQLELQDAHPLFEPAARRALASFAGTRVHAVAGIGYPGRFFDALRASGIAVTEHALSDHHDYTTADLAFGDDLPVLMTEKDAVKCRDLAVQGCWSVPVTARLPACFFDAVAARIAKHQ